MCDMYVHIFIYIDGYICMYVQISIAIPLKIHWKVFFSLNIGVPFYNLNQINRIYIVFTKCKRNMVI